MGPLLAIAAGMLTQNAKPTNATFQVPQMGSRQRVDYFAGSQRYGQQSTPDYGPIMQAFLNRGAQTAGPNSSNLIDTPPIMEAPRDPSALQSRFG